MFSFLQKPNTELEQLRAEYLIERDLILAHRLHEDATKLAERRREDWKMNAAFEASLRRLKEGVL